MGLFMDSTCYNNPVGGSWCRGIQHQATCNHKPTQPTRLFLKLPRSTLNPPNWHVPMFHMTFSYCTFWKLVAAVLGYFSNPPGHQSFQNRTFPRNQGMVPWYPCLGGNFLLPCWIAVGYMLIFRKRSPPSQLTGWFARALAWNHEAQNLSPSNLCKPVPFKQFQETSNFTFMKPLKPWRSKYRHTRHVQQRGQSLVINKNKMLHSFAGYCDFPHFTSIAKSTGFMDSIRSVSGKKNSRIRF